MEEDQQHMRNWLRSLGAPESILQVDLSPLLKAEDSSMWRHLQCHVLPVTKVIEIRKTILLDTLRKRNILPGRFGKFKIISVEEMEQVATYCEKEGELAKQTLRIERVNSDTRSSELTLVKNISKCKSFSCELNERMMKTQLLSEKVAQVKKNLYYLSQQLGVVRFNAKSEANASMDAKMVEKFICSIWLEDHDTEGINHVLDSLRGIFPTTVLRGLERASRSVVVTLVKVFNDMDTQIKAVEDRLQLNQKFSVQQHLSKLQEKYLDNEIKLSNLQKDCEIVSIELSEDKAALVKAIIESMGPDDSKVEESQSLVEEFVASVARRALQTSQVKKLMNLKNTENQQLKQFKEQKIDSQEKYLKCQKVLEEKLAILRALAAKIVKNDLIGTKSEVLEKCTAIAVKRMDKHNQYREDIFLVMSGLMFKELELLVKLPLRVITRSWEEDEYLPEKIPQKLYSQPILLTFLQLQPKYVLLNILEKMTVDFS